MPEASTQTPPIIRKLIKVPRPNEAFSTRVPSLLDQFTVKSVPRFVRDQCWYNAVHNILYFAKHRNLNLRWVVGAQRMWADRRENKFGAIGMRGRKYPDGRKELFTIDRFYSMDALANHFNNSHAWLEDDEGNVYDMIYPSDDEFVRSLTENPVSWRLKPGMIEGVPRDVLDQMGYELIPFSLRSQKVVLEALIEEHEGSSGLGKEGEEAIELLKAIALPSLTVAIGKTNL